MPAIRLYKPKQTREGFAVVDAVLADVAVFGQRPMALRTTAFVFDRCNDFRAIAQLLKAFGGVDEVRRHDRAAANELNRSAVFVGDDSAGIDKLFKPKVV